MAAVLRAFFAAFGAGWLTGFFFATTFGTTFLLGFLAGAFFLADACRFTRRFPVWRLAGRRAADLFRAAFAAFRRLAAFRLAITSVLSEP
jgi:hypothetical protein